jgi:ubiquitin-conjugating enzyme E2 W
MKTHVIYWKTIFLVWSCLCNQGISNAAIYNVSPILRSHVPAQSLWIARHLESSLSIRGGSSDEHEMSNDDIDDNDSDDDAEDDEGTQLSEGQWEFQIANHPIFIKLQNVIRSLVDISKRKTPILIKTLRQSLERIESILGISILPPKTMEKTIKKSKGGSKKTKKSKEKSKKDSSNNSPSSKVAHPTTSRTTSAAITKQIKTKKVTSSSASNASWKHLDTKISSTNPNYRIQRELKEFLQSPPPNLTVKVGSNIRIWIVTLTGAANTIYEGEVYKLRIQFPKDYPMVPPSVYFLPPPPQHEHVYTNGDICLSLLGKDWRPTMTAQSIAVSILSILSSAQSKSIPMDNARHSLNKPGQYQKDWVYHDDNC